MTKTPVVPVVAFVTGYVQAGRWTQCAHCGAIVVGEHYCGAPWQTRADDIPEDWIPGKYKGPA